MAARLKIFLYFYFISVFSFIILSSIIVFSSVAALSAQVTLAWDPNTGQDLGGYKLYYGFESGNYAHTIDVGNQERYSVSDLAPNQIYYFAATAYDIYGNESNFSEEIFYRVPSENMPPVADAGPDQTVDEGVTVTLNGLNSFDADNDIVAYLWEQTNGPVVVLSNSEDGRVIFTTPEVGPDGVFLSFRLTTTDSEGLQDEDDCIVNVTWANLPPSADAGPDQTVDEGYVVTLNGLDSSDPDDGIRSYFWEQTEGLPVNISDPDNIQASFIAPDAFSQDVSLTFQLTVEDFGGLRTTDACMVNVSWTNAPPIADAGPDQTMDEGVTVTLNGSNSSDPDDGIASVRWKQLTGMPVVLSDPRVLEPAFLVPNGITESESLTFQITVTDIGGLSSQDDCNVMMAGNTQIQKLTLNVSDRYDDSFEKINGANYPTYTRTYTGKGYINGYRFQDLAVPPGALILSAALELYCWGFEANDIALEYAGEAVDDAMPFTSVKFDLSSRPKTFETVTDQPAAWTINAFNPSPDLRDILQEIINRPGWVTGNAVNLYVLDLGSFRNRRVTLFDEIPENAARLSITYKTSGPGENTFAPTVDILTPQFEVYHTTASTLSLSGTAGDDIAVTAVSWKSDRGGQGEAEGTTVWNIPPITLYDGENIITVTAWDAEGNYGTDQLVVTRDPEGTSIKMELRISEGNNDAWEKIYNGVNSSTNKAFYLSDAYTGAFRFENVPIPAGATITKACLMFYCRLYNMETVFLKYTGEMSLYSQPFSGKSDDIGSRDRTDAEIGEYCPEWLKDSYNESADISAVIQEIVDHHQWRNGNTVSLFVDTESGKRLIAPFEYDSEKAVILKVEYVQ